MRIEQEIKLNFEDDLLKPKRSTLNSRKDIDLCRDFTFKNSGKKLSVVPIMASNMDGVGTFSVAKILQKYKMITVIKKSYTVEDWNNAIESGLDMEYVSICAGTNAIWDNETQDYQTLKTVMDRFPDIPSICIDVANGYHQQFIDFVKRIRNEFPDKIIIAGNVITSEMVEELIISGADIVKCGIGPGSVCTTRTQTGVGVPQLSGIIECADAANGVDGHIIADGGCTTPGDIGKALGAGAHFVMLGGMLAGHNESEKEVNFGNIEFYGMSSDKAYEIHGARKDGYKGTEGKAILIPSRGAITNSIEEILGGVRSACTYIGARRIKDMPKCATFVRTHNIINKVYNKYEV